MDPVAIRREGTLRFLQTLRIEDCTVGELIAALRVAQRANALNGLRLCDVLGGSSPPPPAGPRAGAPKPRRG